MVSFPTARSSIKKPPILRHRARQGQSASGHSSTNLGYDLSKIDEKVFSDVALAIGQVSNFFGSSKQDKHKHAADMMVGKGSPHKKAASDSLKDVPSYAPEKLMETYAETGTGSSHRDINTLLPFEYTLASYEPSRVDQMESSDVTGKASPHENVHTEKASFKEVTVTVGNVAGTVSSLEENQQSTLVPEPINPEPTTSVDTSQVEDSSVTEQDIFGSTIGEISDLSPDNLHGDDGSYHTYDDEMTESTTDIAPMETKESEKDLSQIEAEFKKVTALPDSVEDKKGNGDIVIKYLD